MVVGVNEVSRKIKEMAFVVFFLNAGNLVSQFPILAFLSGIPCAAADAPTPEISSALKMKKVGCIGVKRSAQEISDFPEILLQVQRSPVVDDIPIGNFELAKAAISDQPKKPPFTVGAKSEPKPAAQKPAPKATPKAAGKAESKKRFFSSLE